MLANHRAAGWKEETHRKSISFVSYYRSAGRLKKETYHKIGLVTIALAIRRVFKHELQR